jgi:hypothetical protein
MSSLRIAALGLALLAGASASAQPAPAEPVLALEPPVFEARYLAEAMGLNATAHRVQTRSEDGLYTLENRLRLTLLGATVGTVTETSAFRWQDGRVMPERYRYSQTGLSAREETVDFDWQTMRARSSRDGDFWTLPLASGVQDKLSYSQNLRTDIDARGLTQMHYAILDTDEIEEQVYDLVGEETLQTPAGALPTVKIERGRTGSSSRRTTVWLARDWHYLLVQVEQVSESGNLTRLTLESATVNGQILQTR